jgi:hypothetical protein
MPEKVARMNEGLPTILETGISEIFAEVKALTLGFSLRATAGRTVKPLMPTMRCCSPSA